MFVGVFVTETIPFVCFTPALNYFVWLHTRPNARQSSSHIDCSAVVPWCSCNLLINPLYLFFMCCLQKLVTVHAQLFLFDSCRWQYNEVTLDLQIKQDNALSQSFKTFFFQERLNSVTWAANNPDLKPIENLWWKWQGSIPKSWSVDIYMRMYEPDWWRISVFISEVQRS